jgi:N-acetylglucosaminyldiphosphoundecaprenol N-acetyl-beta-D-mannosaminyltransferase
MSSLARARAPATPRLRLGPLEVVALDLAGALDAIEALVEARRGGAVFTPNVDHVVKAASDPALRAAYAAADLALADGMPLVWASRLLGVPLPGRVAGSDLVLPLARRAAERGWRVYLLGGTGADAARAGERLRREGVAIAGVDAATVSLTPAGAAAARAAAERVRASRAELVYVALGAPKQELWIHRHRAALGPAVAVGVGASLAFLAGSLRRAPTWVSAAGLEWLWRLGCEPRSMWRRCLVGDVAFLPIVWGAWRARASTRRRRPA